MRFFDIFVHIRGINFLKILKEPCTCDHDRQIVQESFIVFIFKDTMSALMKLSKRNLNAIQSVKEIKLFQLLFQYDVTILIVICENPTGIQDIICGIEIINLLYIRGKDVCCR